MTDKEIEALVTLMVKQDFYATISRLTSPEYAKAFFDLTEEECAEALREYGEGAN